MSVLAIVVAAALFLVAISPAHATLVLEDFNYGTGSGAINGQNGGTGWGGAWTGGGVSLIQYIPTGLIFADVPSSGGAAKFVGQGPITRSFAVAFDHDQNLFGSFLVNVPASDGNLELLGISDAGHATSDSTVQLGFSSTLLNSNNHIPAVKVLGGTAAKPKFLRSGRQYNLSVPLPLQRTGSQRFRHRLDAQRRPILELGSRRQRRVVSQFRHHRYHRHRCVRPRHSNRHRHANI